MKLTKEEKDKSLEQLEKIISSLTSPATKKEIIEGTLSSLDFSERQRKSKSPNSKFNGIRSFIGNSLTDMITNNELIKVDNGNKYITFKPIPKNINKSMCQDAVLESLANNASLTKKELVEKVISILGISEPYYQKEVNMAKCFIGAILVELTKEKKIVTNKDKYLLFVPKHVEETSNNQPLDEVNFKKAFISRLNEKGGAFFENFVTNLLEKYYVITGNEIVESKVIGGVNDGGIDARIDIVDPLGFHERIQIQAKCRKNIKVSEKEVREFYGAMHTDQSATSINKGIIITTSTLHSSAIKLIDSLGSCIGIDGNMLFDIAKRTAYGLKRNSKGYLFDEIVFK